MRQVVCPILAVGPSSAKKSNSSKSLYGREADCAGGEKVISRVVSCCISGCDVLDMKG